MSAGTPQRRSFSGAGAAAVPIYPRSRRLRLTLIAALILTTLSVYGFLHLGTFLADEDPLTKSDVIFVLAGTLAERPLEAAELFREGYAPRIVVTRAPTERAMVRLEQLGITIGTTFDLNQEILLRLGIPKGALILPQAIHDNTAEEAATLRELADRYRWTRIIVVTSKYHLRRSGVAIRRALRGSGVQIVLRGSRHDESTPAHWWTRRRDIRWIASETPKLLAYAVGLGG